MELSDAAISLNVAALENGNGSKRITNRPSLL